MNKYDLKTIQLINLFEKITRANVKTFLTYNDILVFIVKENQARKAVGPKGINVKKLNSLLNKRIKIVEFNNEPVKFIKGFISPIVASDIKVEDKIMEVKVSSTRDKGLLIGRDKKHLNMLKNLVKKYFDIEDIKIV
jgi:N utilization substance protein A